MPTVWSITSHVNSQFPCVDNNKHLLLYYFTLQLVPALEELCLTAPELIMAERYLVQSSLEANFIQEISSLCAKKSLLRKSSLLPLCPFVDSDGVLRVGCREHNADLDYSQKHPVILHGKHHLMKQQRLAFVARWTYSRVLHALCRCHRTKPSQQMLGRLTSSILCGVSTLKTTFGKIY